jgi:hypothetical protein
MLNSDVATGRPMKDLEMCNVASPYLRNDLALNGWPGL